MTRWLSDDEQSTWRGLISLTVQLNAALNRQLQDEHGISLSDYEILVRLHDVPDPGLRARELQASLVWEQSRLSHQLARMRKRGLVERHECSSDRRGASFTLTETGHALTERAAPGHVAAVRRLLFDRLTPADVASIAELTARVAGQTMV